MATVASAPLPYPATPITDHQEQQDSALSLPEPRVSAADKRVSQASACSATSTNSDGKRKMQVGPWRLGRTLGRGSSGRVRLAKNVNTGQLAAVKIVPKSLTPTAKRKDDGKERPEKNDGGLSYSIEREVVIMKLIEHPNVMSLYDVWENRGELYLVLEYIEGGELFDYLVKKGKLEEAEAAKYFRQIIAGVSYCHRFNICHRDLKPENLLLDKDGNIRIADFGMAVLEPKGRLLETSCGSPHYASPEIVAGKNYHGAPSDIWSCGIILFALLTGHLPFDDENIRNLLLKVKAGHFTMPPQLSSEAKDLIWRMLDVDPKTRITMQQIFRHPFIQKYPPLAREFDLPDIPEVDRPVKNEGEIDREIMKNLMILWKGESRATIVERLLSNEPNVEKTFYCLLMRYRQNRLENYRPDYLSPKPQASTTKESASGLTKARKAGSRNSLTNKPGVVFPQPQNKSQPKQPAKSPLPYPTGTVSQKKALLEKQVNNSAQPTPLYPTTPGKQAAIRNAILNKATPKTPPYPDSTVFKKSQASSTVAGPVAAAAAKLEAKALPPPSKEESPKGKQTSPKSKISSPKAKTPTLQSKDLPLSELSPNKQAITKQFATEIEKAFNHLNSPKKPAAEAALPPKAEIPLPAMKRPGRPLPLIPQRPAPVPMRSPRLIGPRSPVDTARQFDEMVANFSEGLRIEGSRSPSIAPSTASSGYSPYIYQDMFADAPDDNTSASSYDLTKPLRTNSSKKAMDNHGPPKIEQLPVLPFKPTRQEPTFPTSPTSPLMLQKEPSRLRIASLITPRPANPLLAVPTLDKRTVSAPMPQPLPLTSPILVDKDFTAPQPVRQKTFKHEFFRAGSLKESNVSRKGGNSAVQHPLQVRMNSMKEPTPVKRKWSSKLKPTNQEKENTPPPRVMATKPVRAPQRKPTWTLAPKKPILPPLQESHAEEEDYPAFESHGEVKRSLFSKIFSIKPLSQKVQTTLPPEQLRAEILGMLQRWESMGIGITNVVEDPMTHVIRAKLSSTNSVGLKAMRFKIHVVPQPDNHSNAIFFQEKGAGSSFTRVVQQIDAVLCGKGFLVSGSSSEKAIPPLTPRLPGIEV